MQNVRLQNTTDTREKEFLKHFETLGRFWVQPVLQSRNGKGEIYRLTTELNLGRFPAHFMMPVETVRGCFTNVAPRLRRRSNGSLIGPTDR